MPTHSGADLGARPRKQSQIGYVDETWLWLDPERAALLGDAIGLVLLVVLETLAPAERLAFVLHDFLAIPVDEIAAIIGRTPDATRQLASRARRRGGPVGRAVMVDVNDADTARASDGHREPREGYGGALRLCEGSFSGTCGST